MIEVIHILLFALSFAKPYECLYVRLFGHTYYILDPWNVCIGVSHLTRFI